MNEESLPTAPRTHTNARGTTYFLCSVATKAGKQRLVASRTVIGTPLTSMPEGFEFAENVNGQVSVRKKRTPMITPEELAVVREALAAPPGCEPYRVAIERDAIVIYEPSMWPTALERLADEYLGGRANAALVQRMRNLALENAMYSPLVRFVLSDATRRTFHVERRFFSGDGRWLPVEPDKHLEFAARQAVKRLGPKGPKDAFFEWV